MMSNPQIVFAQLVEVRTQTLKYLDGLTQEQLDWKPSYDTDESEWSLGEVFMHLAIDEVYLRELIAVPLLEGVKPPEMVGFLPPPPPYKQTKEVINYWFERARLQTRRYFETWPADPNLDVLHEGGLRVMNGLEWLEGYGGHEAFHHQQIEHLIAQVSGEL